MGKYYTYYQAKSTCNIKRTDWNTLNLWNMLFASEILLKLIAVGWVYCVRHYSTVNKYFGTLCNRRTPPDGFAEQNGRDAERAD